MMTTEATLGQQVDVPVQSLDPAASTFLPLTAGDAALESEGKAPEHGWPGSWFIILSNLAAIGMGLGALGMSVVLVVSLLSGEFGSMGWTALTAVGLALGCVLQRTLARHVEHFSRWGWWGAMAELGLATLTKVNVLITQPDAWIGAACGIVIDLLWMRYFWESRADFGIDFDV